MDKDLGRLDTELTQALAGLDARETQATPRMRPEKWTIQQIVEHLLLTWDSTIPGIEARIQKRSPTRSMPTFRQRMGQVIVLRLGRFPAGTSAPAAVSPSFPASVRSGEELAKQIQTELERLDRVTAQAETLFGSGRDVSHPMFGPLSMTQWRRFHLVHGLHHARQIKLIRRDNVSG